MIRKSWVQTSVELGVCSSVLVRLEKSTYFISRPNHTVLSSVAKNTAKLNTHIPESTCMPILNVSHGRVIVRKLLMIIVHMFMHHRSIHPEEDL